MKNMGDLESAVMNILWAQSGPATVREVLATMDREPPLAYTTVMTVMDNLHRKGFLVRKLDGRAYRYRPTKARTEYTAELMNELLAGSGDRSSTLLRFVDHMTPEEISSLKRALGTRSRRGSRA
jgi:predicted transcriptional regulator